MSSIQYRVATRFLQATHQLQAKVVFKGKESAPFRIIYQAFVDHMIGSGVTVYLHPRKSTGNAVGYVRSTDLAKGVLHIFYKSGSVDVTLERIGHELTHVLQYKRGDLAFKDGMILWKGEPYMSESEYKALPSKSEQEKLPWEAEAYREGTAKADAFKAKIPSLRGKDKQLDWLIDNNLI